MKFRIALLITSLIACASDAPESATEQCTAVRDHLIELRLADASGVDRAAHARAMSAALGADFLERCQTGLSEQQRSCVVNAVTAQIASNCTADR